MVVGVMASPREPENMQTSACGIVHEIIESTEAAMTDEDNITVDQVEGDASPRVKSQVQTISNSHKSFTESKTIVKKASIETV